MEILGLLKLDKFKKKHANAVNPINAWILEVQAAKWETSQDIKNRYVTASFLAGNRVIFNIKGNDYRLVVKVKYQNDKVVIEWVGTHSEYDRQSF